jgi:sortase A
MLKDIRRGDAIVLQTANAKFLYRVKNTHVVSPQNTRALRPSAGPVLNLITCYPFYYVGSAPKRFVVEARLAGKVAVKDVVRASVK